MLQRFVELQQIGVDQKLTNYALCKIPVRLLDQGKIQIRGLIAQEGKLILAPAATLELGGIIQKQPRLPKQVQRRVGKSQFLLECRRFANPFTQALGEYQAGVGQAQYITESWLRWRIRPDGARCPGQLTHNVF